MLSDRGATRELVERAAQPGYEALVVTVDRPVLGIRERELRANVVRDRPTPAPGAAGRGRSPAAGRSTRELSWWSDIEQIAADSPLPLLVKGVLTAEDAGLASPTAPRG